MLESWTCRPPHTPPRRERAREPPPVRPRKRYRREPEPSDEELRRIFAAVTRDIPIVELPLPSDVHPVVSPRSQRAKNMVD